MVLRTSYEMLLELLSTAFEVIDGHLNYLQCSDGDVSSWRSIPVSRSPRNWHAGSPRGRISSLGLYSGRFT
jgi:hypothetical protein